MSSPAPGASPPFPLKRVLVLTDLSAAATNAAWRAALLARDHGAWLRVLHVGARRGVADAQEALDALAADMQQRCKVAVLAQAVHGRLPREVLAASTECDLLVLRASQGQPLRDWLAGVHPERVLRQCAAPVLVVKRPATVSYRRVLVSLGLDSHAPAAIAVAAGMLHGPHDEVLQALAARPEFTPEGAAEALRRGSGHDAAQRLRAQVQALMEDAGARRALAAPSLAVAHPTEMLLARERSVMPDLLVIGPSGQDQRAAPLPPADPRAVLARTRADLLVLPGARRTAAAGARNAAPWREAQAHG